MPHIDVALDSVPHDTPVRLENGSSGIVVLRTGESIRAYHDECPHAGWRLSDGFVAGTRLECPGHGWQFDIQSGRCVDVPAYCLNSVMVTRLGESLRFEWADQA
jgi:nitrite reductase/ring-hydroxylating ferredoxin subunit